MRQGLIKAIELDAKEVVYELTIWRQHCAVIQPPVSESQEKGKDIKPDEHGLQL